MNKSFQTQPELFVASAELDHPALQGLDGAEAVLDWDRLERLMEAIYGGKNGAAELPAFDAFPWPFAGHLVRAFR